VNVPDENPSGLGAFEFPMRFPGQYFDKETNLGYNLMRDYDPALGRYDQSDPIGLRGGLDTYTYVASDPIRFADLNGLIRNGPTQYNTPPPATAPVPMDMEWKVSCIELCLDKDLIVTGGAEQKGHSKGSKHYSGDAADFGFPSNPGIQNQSNDFFCCALKCGFGFGQTEGDHYHVQQVPGLNVPAIPSNVCSCKK
jgi:RHS repeat-associated protein